MIFPNILQAKFEYFLLVIWLASVIVLWLKKDIFSKEYEKHARIFIYYFILSFLILLVWIGKSFINNNYLPNIISETIGIGITVFIIERVYNYINTKNEKLYRKLALKTCKMPIYTYCANWFFIFEQDNKKCIDFLEKYDSLESFFMSDEFYEKIILFDFNGFITKDKTKDKTYAKYYDENMIDIKDRFQSILAKYASKLSYKDLNLLEHFGGSAYIYSVFACNKFISEVKFTHHYDNKVEEVLPFNNCFKDVRKENFSKHFQKLIELINEYNNAVENDYEKWTIKNINKLHTIKTANENPNTNW